MSINKNMRFQNYLNLQFLLCIKQSMLKAVFVCCWLSDSLAIFLYDSIFVDTMYNFLSSPVFYSYFILLLV